MKLYLAGPMSNRTRWNFDAFEAAADALRTAGHDVISPAEIELDRGFDPSAPVEEFTPDKYQTALLRDLALIASEADGVAVLPDWQESNGATAEVALAVALGLTVAPVSALSQMEACS